MTPANLATFIANHPDFRSSPWQCITLPSPFILATTQFDLNYARNEILPRPHDFEEGSLWDLVLLSTPTWLAQANRAYHVDIGAWLTRNEHDLWSGIHPEHPRMKKFNRILKTLSRIEKFNRTLFFNIAVLKSTFSIFYFSIAKCIIFQ